MDGAEDRYCEAGLHLQRGKRARSPPRSPPRSQGEEEDGNKNKEKDVEEDVGGDGEEARRKKVRMTSLARSPMHDDVCTTAYEMTAVVATGCTLFTAVGHYVAEGIPRADIQHEDDGAPSAGPPSAGPPSARAVVEMMPVKVADFDRPSGKITYGVAATPRPHCVYLPRAHAKVYISRRTVGVAPIGNMPMEEIALRFVWPAYPIAAFESQGGSGSGSGSGSGVDDDAAESVRVHLKATCSDFLRAADAFHSRNTQSDQVDIYLFSREVQEWEFSHSLPKRRKNTLVLADGQIERLLSDARSFVAHKDFFLEHGFVHARNYLLDGPPGLGKTSAAFVVASELGYKVALLSCNDAAARDGDFWDAVQNVPEKCILVIEDVDAMFHPDDATNHDHSHVSFMAFLQATDGLACKQGLMAFYTSNNKQRISDTILSRFHRVEDFGYPTIDRTIRIVSIFFPPDSKLEEECIAEFCTRLHAMVPKICLRILHRTLLQWKMEGTTIAQVVDADDDAALKKSRAISAKISSAQSNPPTGSSQQRQRSPSQTSQTSQQMFFTQNINKLSRLQVDLKTHYANLNAHRAMYGDG